MLDLLRSLTAYQQIVADIKDGVRLPGLGLPRAVRLPILAALHTDLNWPILFVTDRADKALLQLDELAFWAPSANRLYFPEPTPLFYEQAAWGTTTRRDRLLALTKLAVYHIPGICSLAQPAIWIAPVRALMTRTLPRRDFLKHSRILRLGQQHQLENLKRSWVAIGYEAVEIVLEPGQFSHRGGLLDIWPPGEQLPVRLDFFGDEIETLRHFDPATQRTVQKLDHVLVMPAREVLPHRVEELNLSLHNVDEFYLPLLHPQPASLLEYLPQQSLVVIDDLDHVQLLATEIEEQAVKLRNESIREGLLSDD
ncbi:MAG: hypothetical protein WHV66_10950, partial [Anaerolineales bacterium]